MRYFFFLLFWSLLSISFAEEGPFSSCQEEIRKYCSSYEKVTERVSCLLTVKDSLSSDCQQELQRVSQTLEATGVRGGGGLSSFGGVMGRFGLLPPKKTIVSANGQMAPEGNPVVIQQGRINVSTPIWTKQGKSFSLSTGAGSVVFNETQKFDNGQNAPQELHRIEAGGQYTRTTKDGLFGGKLSVGSASDRPFHSKDEMAYSLNGFYTANTTGDRLWIWTVFLSNNNPVANFVPIPGFIYLYKEEGFTGMFGLPFLSIQWTPKEPWVFSVSSFLTNLNTEVAYGFRDQLQVFTGFAISQQSFLREGREDSTDRLFFNEKRIFTGVKSPYTKEVSLEFQTGLSFDRSLKEGRRFNDTHLEADLGRSWFVSLGMNLAI